VACPSAFIFSPLEFGQINLDAVKRQYLTTTNGDESSLWPNLSSATRNEKISAFWCSNLGFKRRVLSSSSGGALTGTPAPPQQRTGNAQQMQIPQGVDEQRGGKLFPVSDRSRRQFPV
jgi:hypothetical protein